MIRTTMESILCLVLSPLLAALQASAQPARQADILPASAQVFIPKDTEFHLIGLETHSSAPAKKGDPVRFAVTKDVVLDGVKVIPVGTPVIGRVVSKARSSQTPRRLSRVSLQRLTLSSGTEVPLTPVSGAEMLVVE